MKKRINKKLALNKMTVSDLERISGGDSSETKFERSFCICVYTDLCGTSQGIFCEVTCAGMTCSMADPCCL